MADQTFLDYRGKNGSHGQKHGEIQGTALPKKAAPGWELNPKKGDPTPVTEVPNSEDLLASLGETAKQVPSGTVSNDPLENQSESPTSVAFSSFHAEFGEVSEDDLYKNQYVNRAWEITKQDFFQKEVLRGYCRGFLQKSLGALPPVLITDLISRSIETLGTEKGERTYRLLLFNVWRLSEKKWTGKKLAAIALGLLVSRGGYLAMVEGLGLPEAVRDA